MKTDLPSAIDRHPPPVTWLAILDRIPGTILIALARLYQVTLGPFLGGHCRFQPTCSNYFIQAVRKHGSIRGAWKGILRIGRCHPFHRGGYDPP